MGLPFFGLNPEHKPQIHNEIFELIYFGSGFTHSDVYNMPSFLRKFYYKKLSDTKQKESDEIKKAQQKSKPPKSRFGG